MNKNAYLTIDLSAHRSAQMGTKMEGLKNLMEDNVEKTINRLLPTMPNICSCQDCKLDMAVYALNRLQPKYSRSTAGAILQRFDSYTTQSEAAVLTAVVSAIEVVGNNPRHSPKP